MTFTIRMLPQPDDKSRQKQPGQAAASLILLLQNHLKGVNVLHEQALAAGHGAVYLPYTLEREYQ